MKWVRWKFDKLLKNKYFTWDIVDCFQCIKETGTCGKITPCYPKENSICRQAAGLVYPIPRFQAH